MYREEKGAIRSYETFLSNNQTTRHHIPEYRSLIHSCKELKSQIATWTVRLVQSSCGSRGPDWGRRRTLLLATGPRPEDSPISGSLSVLHSSSPIWQPCTDRFAYRFVMYIVPLVVGG
jgi:hypothetical protein